MANNTLLQEAIELARRAHAGQTDKAGAPYFGHLERVMNGVSGDDLKIIAILHDSIEDSNVDSPIHITRTYLIEAGYPAHVVEAIEALTKRPEEEDSDEGYMRFIARAAQNPLARQVKMADLRDNMDRTRIALIADSDLQRWAKYERAMTFLRSL